MEKKDLTPHGYPGYWITENGWVINQHGRMLRGSINKQVCLMTSSGVREWRSLAWLVATAFVPQPPGCLHIRYKDGDSDNLHYTNLEWTPIAGRNGSLKASILNQLQEGKSIKEIAQWHNVQPSYVRRIAEARLRELQAIEQMARLTDTP